MGNIRENGENAQAQAARYSLEKIIKQKTCNGECMLEVKMEGDDTLYLAECGVHLLDEHGGCLFYSTAEYGSNTYEGNEEPILANAIRYYKEIFGNEGLAKLLIMEDA